MSLEPKSESVDALFWCQEPGCLIRYNASQGYFLNTQDNVTLKEEIPPRIFCSVDKSPMYLAETQTKSKSYRLWKCPECGTSRTNEEISDGWGKTAGA